MDNSEKLSLFKKGKTSRSAGLTDVPLKKINPGNLYPHPPLIKMVPFYCAYNDGSGGFYGEIEDSDVGNLSTWSGVSCAVLYA